MITDQTTCPMMSDADLVIAAQNGNDQAFSELFNRHRHSCVRRAISILKNAADAEEEVQNAFWRAYTNIERFQGDAQFTTWLSRIVINQCLMRLRSAKRKRTFSIDDVQVGDERVTLELRDTQDNPEEGMGREQVIKITQAEIRRIPPLLRDVLVMKDIEQRPIDEVALHFRITVAAVKSRLLRARRMLRERLERHAGVRGAGTLTAEFQF
jgi:RNA polymerase sigma-70 factor (ECF subfamily)